MPLRALNETLHCTTCGIQAVTCAFLPAPGARKEPALVGVGLEVNLEHPLKLGFMKDHPEALPFP